MAGGRQVVAWVSKAEWEQVLEYLYSRDCKLQRDAVHQITAWKSRYGNSMPLAVECTADLVRCKILDMSGGLGEQELTLLYGLALVRFTNLITEAKQKTISIPLRRLANELKIPEWIVDLRHSATHGKLPKLSLCRKGWDFVMEWLRRMYWSRQLGNSSNPQWVSADDVPDESEDVFPVVSLQEQKQQLLCVKLREKIQAYRSEQFKTFQELQSETNSKKSWNSTSDLDPIIEEVKELTLQNCTSTAVEILLEEGFLIPASKQLLTLKLLPHDQEEDFHLPRTLLRFWQPLLKALHSQPFTQELLEKMFTGLGLCKESNTDARGYYLTCWISEILAANYSADRKCTISRNQTPVKSKWKLFNSGVCLQWKKLMQKCLESPSRATPHLLKLIFSYLKTRLPVSTQENLLCLCSIYTQDEGSDASADNGDGSVYTVESLQLKLEQQSKSRAYSQWGRPVSEEEMNEHTEDEEMIVDSNEEEYIQNLNIRTAAERRPALEGSSWRVSSEIVNWGEYPLGIVPGQTSDPGCLLIDSYSMMSVLEQQVSEARRNGHRMPMSSPSMNTSSDNTFWSQTELNRIKAGMRLF